MSKPIKELQGTEIDYWYLRACGYSINEVMFDDQGFLTFYINDDYHPPGFFYWQRHDLTDEEMLKQIYKYYGISVPV